jgi:uncharacterized protein YbjT (DUF2867 family)
MASKVALVAGASGLVGGELLKVLLAAPEYGQVIALVRRPLALQHLKLEQAAVNFAALDAHPELFRVDEVFCALGTTIKQAGSQAAFRQVDLEYPAAMARLAREGGARQFLLVTAMGADPGSRIFYNRVKGEAEEAVRGAGLPAVHIFRPSLLLGERRERRPGELAAAALCRVVPFVGPLRKYRPIQGRTVAEAMHRVAAQGAAGVHIYESGEIAAIVEQ